MTKKYQFIGEVLHYYPNDTKARYSSNFTSMYLESIPSHYEASRIMEDILEDAYSTSFRGEALLQFDGKLIDLSTKSVIKSYNKVEPIADYDDYDEYDY